MGAVRIGVLGCADIARRRVLPALVAHPDFTVVAVASRHREKAADFAQRFGAEPVVGYAELLRRGDLDAVYVPLPPTLRDVWVPRALEAGLHVLTEKPLATDRRAAARLVGMARARGRALLENVMFVHHSQHAVVRSLLLQGAIGEVRSFSATFTVPPRPADDFRYRPELGGGCLADMGVYPVRAAQYFLDGPLTVVGATLRRGDGAPVEVAGDALLCTRQGAGVHVTFGMAHAYRSSYEILGSAGRICVEHAFTPPADHTPRIVIHRADGVEERVLAADDQVARTLDTFRRLIAEPTTGSSLLAASLTEVRLLEQIRLAARWTTRPACG
ncbi:MAG TPA: Gfo/Idh/MocA family oxidoreductase [Micromonospora sp.]